MRACLLRVTWCRRGELLLQELNRESEACVHVAVMLPLLRGSFPLLVVLPPLSYLNLSLFYVAGLSCGFPDPECVDAFLAKVL